MISYEIELKVTNKETGEVVGLRSSEQLEVIEMSIGDVKKWIDKWERENVTTCTQCRHYVLKSDISYKSTDPDETEPVCQDCIHNIINGTQPLKEK